MNQDKRSKVRNRSVAVAFTVLVALLVLASNVFAINGSINPLAIEIDQNANLHPASNFPPGYGGNGTVLNPSATADWVQDNLNNVGTNCLNNSIATCNQANVTAATGGLGHWRGARIVDGIAGAEQDIFTSGGKEDNTAGWSVGPGSVGSPKYDVTQAYLANNQQNLYFGMERRGNNGSTAFDFEFNVMGTEGTYIPVRTPGDILFTFEMQGSGGSGSATPHVFKWTCSGSTCSYVEQSIPAGTFASINSSARPSAPWGTVDSQGNWVLADIERFEFAEAVAPLTLFGLSGCGGNAYVQVRTRSSSTANSDLKDTTKIFSYVFGGPAGSGQLSTSCNQNFTFNGTASRDSGGGTNLSYSWVFTPTSGITLGGGGVTGPDGNGAYHSSQITGTVAVTLPLGTGVTTIPARLTVTENGSTCTSSTGELTVTVYRQLNVVPSLTPQCSLVFGYASTVTGGRAPYSYAWQFQKNSQPDGSGTWTTVGTSTTISGTFNAPSAGAYRGVLTVNDTADPGSNGKPQCSVVQNSNVINVYSAVGGSATLTPDCDDTFAYSASGSGGKSPYTFAWTIEKLVSGSWVSAYTFNDGPATTSSGTLDVDSFSPGGDGHYRARVTITDSQGLSCNVQATSNEIDVAHPLTVSILAPLKDGNALTVTLTGTVSYTSGTTLQWQRETAPGSTVWVSINGATSANLVYSSFEADATPTPITFTIATGDGAGDYTGKLYRVSIRLHAERVLNGNTCTADSNPVLLKKVTAVDP